MAVVKIRNAADDGWIQVGGGVEVAQQAAEPTSTFPGQLWLDTSEVFIPSGFVMLDMQEASASSELEFTGFSSWNKIYFTFEDIIPGSDAANFDCQFGNDSGYDTSTNYNRASFYIASSGHGHQGGDGTTSFTLMFSLGTSTAELCSGTFQCFGLQNGTYKNAMADVVSNNSYPALYRYVSGYQYDVTSNVTKIKFYCNGTTIASGRISMFGVYDGSS